MTEAEQPLTPEQAEAELREWRRVTDDRDSRIRRAREAGLSKYKIHQVSGVGRPTIDKILEEQ